MLTPPIVTAESKAGALLKSLLFLITFVGVLMLSGRLSAFLPPTYHSLAYGIIGSMAGLLTVWLFIRKDKMNFETIGLSWRQQTPRLFLSGCGIGLALFTLMLLSLVFFTALKITFQPNTSVINLLWALLPVFPLALMEEIGFRSYPQFKINEVYGVLTSQFVIALVFGAYHILNGWSVFLSFSGPAIWAFVFGLAALRTKSIAVPAGIHFTLNILQTLCGMKGKNGILQLYYANGIDKAAMIRAEYLGFALHLVVLTGALAATYIYIKTDKTEKRST